MLALGRGLQLDLVALNGNMPDLRLPAEMSTRDALSVMLTDGGGRALVLDGERPLGIASVDAISALLADASPHPGDAA